MNKTNKLVLQYNSYIFMIQFTLNSRDSIPAFGYISILLQCCIIHHLLQQDCKELWITGNEEILCKKQIFLPLRYWHLQGMKTQFKKNINQLFYKYFILHLVLARVELIFFTVVIMGLVWICAEHSINTETFCYNIETFCYCWPGLK